MAGWMSRMRLSVGVLGLWMLTMAPPAQAQVDPYEIIDRVDELYRGESSHGTSTMEVVTENWTRQMTMELWSLGNDYSLVRIQAPAREAGTATLKADRDIYNYLPKVDRTIKIPTSMMGGSWMGSHFTNDDLVQESRLVDDYDITLSFSGDRNGEVVWEFTLVPKQRLRWSGAKSTTGYAKRTTCHSRSVTTMKTVPWPGQWTSVTLPRWEDEPFPGS